MTLEEWKQKLTEGHFGELWVHTDPPGREYSEHTHPVDSVYVVLKGAMTVLLQGKEQVVGEGQRLDIAKEVLHTATIGSQGCTFLMGVRI